MKRIKIISFVIIIVLFPLQSRLFSQILENGGRIPPLYQIDWTNAGLLPENRSVGLLPETPTQADRLIIITNMVGADWDEKLENAITEAEGEAGTSIIFFPGGVYELNSPIELSNNNNHSNIIFQGAGANASILQFTLGKDGNCFTIHGDAESPNTIDYNINMHDSTFTCSAITFDAGNWVHFHEGSYPAESGADIGQITQILNRDNNIYKIKDEAAKDYSINYTLEIMRVNPISNVGIENMTLMRMDVEKSTDDDHHYGCGNTIKFSHAVNCWIKGVHSDKTCRHHITIDRCSHIEISGCYIHNAVDYGENSYGYGVVLGTSSTNCLIENNIFKKLRHAMGIGTGANSNVLIYNYSTDQYSTWNGIHYDDSDICIHGRYSYSNLYEHNYVEWIEADTEHGENGPYNAFVRNKVSRENNIELNLAPVSSVIGCEIHHVNVDLASMFYFDQYGWGYGQWMSHLEANDYDKSQFVLGDVSYYYSAPPDFIGSLTFPSIGPKRASGYPLPSNNIPARIRYKSHTYTYLSDPIEFPSGIPEVLSNGSASLTNTHSNETITFYNNTRPFLPDGAYKCDVYELKADVYFCPSYTETPKVWLNQTGYAGSNPNYSIFYLNENSTAANSIVSTFFFYVKTPLGGGGEQINEWVPYDPTPMTPEYEVLGIPGNPTTSGILSHNEAWCNTHTLTGNVTIPSGITLWILPGTQVYIPSGKKITVQGTLIAEGTASERIYFDKSGSSKWYGIKFENSSDDDDCILKYCTIQNASYGAYCYKSSPFIYYCNINNNTIGIYKAYGTAQQDIFYNDIGYNSFGGVSLTNASSWINVRFNNNDVHHSSYVNFNCSYIPIGPDMYGNKIRNSSGNGINLYSSTAYLENNFVYDNNGYGIYCNSSSPELSYSYKPGKNVVAYNGSYGIYGDVSSQPKLGTPVGNYDPYGKNSYYSNDPTYDVYSLSSSWLPAGDCYWGGGAPKTYGNVWHWWNILYTDPNDDPHGLQKAIAHAPENNNPEESEHYQVNENARHHYNLGYELELKGNYDAALERYKFVITNYPETLEAEMSLTRILLCYHKTDRSQAALSYLGTLTVEKGDYRVGGKALGHLIRQLVQDGDYKTALANCTSQLQKFADSDIAKDALFTQWQIYFDGLNDKQNAKSAMDQFENSFPDDYLLAHIKIAMGLWTPEMEEKFMEKLPKRFGEQPEQTAAVEIPEKFSLSGNYPNPFNPETTIKFGLPEESRIIIEIFNVLGQKVKELLDSEKPAGYHQVRWDGTDEFGKKVGAGIYLCRMQAGNFIKTQKMMLLP